MSCYYALLLVLMLFLHIIEDFHLQGKLGNYKQKLWVLGEVNRYGDKTLVEKCKYDWIVGLCCHSFEWSFCITLPLLVWTFLFDSSMYCWYFVFLGANCILHGLIDHWKCNRLGINLIQDQLLHLVQIVLTWDIYTSLLK